MDGLALVIGNSDYTKVGKLNNPQNDANDMEKVLQKLNFDVTKLINATEPLLNDLHKSFAVFSRDEQRFANMFLLDVQRGKVTVDEGKTLMEYISEYRAAARNDSIHRFATDIGVDEAMLRSFMDRHVTNENINAFGLFDSLMNSVDMAVAKAYFEKQEGHEIKPFRVRAKVDNALRKFILADNVYCKA